MTVFVKICGMTDEAGLAAAVDAGADAVGFVFYERSPRNLDVTIAAKLRSQVPDHVTAAAVMLHPDAEYCAHVLEVVQPDVIQTDRADFDYLRIPDDIEWWPVLREGEATGNMPQRFVYEASASGQGQRVDWERASLIARSGDMMLAGGLDAGNVAEAIERVRPWGVDVSSAVESSPGRKDPQKIRNFVAAAREQQLSQGIRNDH